MRQFFASLKENPIRRRRVIGVLLYAVLTAALLFCFRGLFLPKEGERPLLCRLWYAGLWLSPVCGAAVGLRRAVREEKRRLRWIGPVQLLAILANAAVLFGMIELVNNKELLEMEWYYVLFNIGVITVLGVWLAMVFNSLKWAMLSLNVFFFCMSLVFYYVYLFRGEAFQLIDIFSFGTAMDVVGGYHFAPTREIVTAAVVCLFLVRLWLMRRDYCFARKDLRAKVLVRAAAAAIAVLMSVVYFQFNWNREFGIISNLWNPAKTYREYGTTVGFLAVAKYMRLTPPEEYSLEEVKELAAAAETIPDDARRLPNAGGKNPVNIIAVMNESWFDYRVVADPQMSGSFMPFLDSLQENIIRGYTLTCTKGGGTAKTEFEFLTGDSCKRFPGMVPYVNYFTHDHYSLVTTLKDQGYRAVAMHPNKATNWRRSIAYPLLSFDEFIAIDDFPSDAQRYRNMISDRANYEKLVKVYEEKEPGEKLFLFDITMQNHSGYQNQHFPATIDCVGYDSDEVDQYFSLLRLSDEALRYLITYFEQVEEPTMILMFGDHSPKLPDDFETWLAGEKYADLPLGEQEKFYGTPFFIWTNYEMEEESDVLLSTNYLSSYLLSLTGLSMTPYNRYLLQLREQLPALNHLGYLAADGTWHTWTDGRAEELELEREYECIQYNELMDGSRIDDFFRISE